MAEKYLEISKIGGCRGNIGHVKERDLSTTLEVTITKKPAQQSGLFCLFKNLLGEHGEIDTPVAPDVTSVGLYILVLVTLAVPVVAQVNSALIEEVGVTHSHPVELGLAGEQTGTLICKLRILLDLIGKRILITTVG